MRGPSTGRGAWHPHPKGARVDEAAPSPGLRSAPQRGRVASGTEGRNAPLGAGPLRLAGREPTRYWGAGR